MKYTSEQLKEMAITFLFEYNSNNHKANMMLMLLAQVTNMQPQQIIANIQYLAKYEAPNND